MKSKDWLNRQKKDFFVKKAKQKGYLSRSAFKLIEIDNRFKIIKKARKGFEFGAAPGGWSQVISELNPNIKITAPEVLDTPSENLKWGISMDKMRVIAYEYAALLYNWLKGRI